MWLPTPAVFVVAQVYGASFDWGVVAAGYLGVVYVYALFCAIGILTSTLSESPVMSMLLAIVIEIILFFLMLLPSYWQSPTAKEIASHFSIYQILGDSLAKGIVDTSHLVFFASAVALLLFAATRSLEVRRWR